MENLHYLKIHKLAYNYCMHVSLSTQPATILFCFYTESYHESSLLADMRAASIFISFHFCASSETSIFFSPTTWSIGYPSVGQQLQHRCTLKPCGTKNVNQSYMRSASLFRRKHIVGEISRKNFDDSRFSSTAFVFATHSDSKHSVVQRNDRTMINSPMTTEEKSSWQF